MDLVLVKKKNPEKKTASGGLPGRVAVWLETLLLPPRGMLMLPSLPPVSAPSGAVARGPALRDF